MGYFRLFFLHTPELFTERPLNYYLLKVKKFHGDSVKNENARAKN